ncbi:hypothetical protein N5K27_22415 [Pigmentiphaga sp. GD03639]|uniref:hypothetical protein n=1 Tax=Pigmentiphaga sp. GD03639 TaxID=2975354 RepID=UPI002448B039|nr:hypothetical protein [Pigmentiphaga sp. GD03639]MDH2239066.1 hypothetical protein [Pigmentiphaga sp. GD03639]
MATIDARIPLGVQPVQIENPLAQFAQAAQIQGIQQRNRLYDLQMQEAEREAASRNALNEAWRTNIGPDGSVNRTGLVGALAQIGQGAQIPGLQKQFADMDASQRQAAKSQLELAGQKLALGAQLLGGVTDQASYDEARQVAQASGLDVSQFPPQYSPQIIQMAQQRALTAQQRLEQQWKALGFDLEQQRFAEAQRHNRTQEGISAGTLGVAQQRLALEQAAPRGQVVTTADGGVVLVDPRTGTAQPVTGQDGQQIRGRTPGQLTGAQLENARAKLQTVAVLRQQIENLKSQRENLGIASEGLVAGRNPLSEAGRNYDAALSALQTTVRQLTRTPGEGAMSDYESRLAMAQLPSRADFASARDLKIQQLEDLADTIERGYSGLVGSSGGSRAAAAAPAQPSRQPPLVSSDAEYNALPSGAVFIDPNGQQRRKP